MVTADNWVCAKLFLVFISYVMFVNFLMCKSMYVCICMCQFLLLTRISCWMWGNIREHVCKEHEGQYGGSLSCNELY